MHVVFVWKRRFVFREYAELLSCVTETQREMADEEMGRVNRGLQHPLTSLYILMGSCFCPLRQVSTTYSYCAFHDMPTSLLSPGGVPSLAIAIFSSPTWGHWQLAEVAQCVLEEQRPIVHFGIKNTDRIAFVRRYLLKKT